MMGCALRALALGLEICLSGAALTELVQIPRFCLQHQTPAENKIHHRKQEKTTKRISTKLETQEFLNKMVAIFSSLSFKLKNIFFSLA